MALSRLQPAEPIVVSKPEAITPIRRLLDLLGRMTRARMALAGMVILFVFVLVSLSADVISPHDPTLTDGYRSLEAPSLSHPFGLDRQGRDVLSRVIYGGRISLSVGVVAVLIAAALGVPLGIASGYFGGRLDDVVQRLMDALYSFPQLLLALALVAAMGPSVFNIMLAIGLTTVPVYCRMVRSQTLAAREFDYVTAAKATGASQLRIMAFHIWPNVTAPIIVQSSLGMAAAILAEAGLSFLGVGVRPPTPTWGGMLSEGFPFLQKAPWLSVYPGLAIFLTVLALNVVGDALRDVLDPKLKHITNI